MGTPEAVASQRMGTSRSVIPVLLRALLHLITARPRNTRLHPGPAIDKKSIRRPSLCASRKGPQIFLYRKIHGMATPCSWGRGSTSIERCTEEGRPRNGNMQCQEWYLDAPNREVHVSKILGLW
jgi:hypothetical protein